MDMDSESIDQLVRSPLGAAFLMVAKESGLRPEEAAEPMNCLQIAAVASEWISVHRGGDYGRTKQHVLERGPEFVSFGRDIITAGDCGWWTAPAVGTLQVYSPRTEDATEPTPADIRGPESTTRRANSWEQYAQKPQSLMTSSYLGGTSSILVGISRRSDDWYFVRTEGPIPAWTIGIAAQARVFEVLGPAQWHELCTHYPAVVDHPGSPAHGLLVPDWSAVRQDWDGVHLTFFGWLCAAQNRFTDGDGTSMHWAWDAEATVWLRWVFSSVSSWPHWQLPPRSRVIGEPYFRPS